VLSEIEAAERQASATEAKQMSHLDTVLLVLLAAYFMPAIVASVRHHASSMAIFALNLLLGWTFIGWVLALVWSLTGNVRPPLLRPDRDRNRLNW
jgi:hypothetical protein